VAAVLIGATAVNVAIGADETAEVGQTVRIDAMDVVVTTVVDMGTIETHVTVAIGMEAATETGVVTDVTAVVTKVHVVSDQWRGSDRRDDRGQWGSRNDRGPSPRDSRGGRDPQGSREGGGSRERGGQDSRRDDRGGDNRYPSRNSGQGSNNTARPEGFRASEERGSGDEDYDLFCSVLSDIDTRRANRRKN